MGRKSQRKGADGERELTAVFQAHGYDVIRGGSLSFGEVPDLMGLTGIHVEVKRTEKLNLRAAMEQAVRDAEFFKDGSPAVFHRANRQPWMVTMLLEDWLRMYQGGGDALCTTHGEHGAVHSSCTTKSGLSTAKAEAGSK